MRPLLLASALLLSGLATSAQSQEAKQDFTLVNRTGYTIDEVYVSPSKADTWEEDVLGKDSLEDGDSTHITFHRANRTCFWDLKVVYADDDSSAYWRGIDLCKIEKITIKYNRRTDTTSATFD
jgi:hypothetical protein